MEKYAEQTIQNIFIQLGELLSNSKSYNFSDKQHRKILKAWEQLKEICEL